MLLLLFSRRPRILRRILLLQGRLPLRRPQAQPAQTPTYPPLTPERPPPATPGRHRPLDPPECPPLAPRLGAPERPPRAPRLGPPECHPRDPRASLPEDAETASPGALTALSCSLCRSARPSRLAAAFFQRLVSTAKAGATISNFTSNEACMAWCGNVYIKHDSSFGPSGTHPAMRDKWLESETLRTILSEGVRLPATL